jgi:hypothetical protein
MLEFQVTLISVMCVSVSFYHTQVSLDVIHCFEIIYMEAKLSVILKPELCFFVCLLSDSVKSIWEK